ncbi:hypothetical protein CA260_19130 [Dyella jiangningensis]|uniref:Uncharacterized protein n=1 Tax=Dyella jiangningensis TaxID=1379159 RepID=A0A328P2Z8_9GAMM|nr:hypothetical protein CA260_19130 [Dyella jiangningensis]
MGQKAGYYWSAHGHDHSFVETNGHFQTLDVPGAVSTLATTINNFGVVSGYYTDANHQQHGFVATPSH